jgi:hypothetical protein
MVGIDYDAPMIAQSRQIKRSISRAGAGQSKILQCGLSREIFIKKDSRFSAVKGYGLQIGMRGDKSRQIVRRLFDDVDVQAPGAFGATDDIPDADAVPQQKFEAFRIVFGQLTIGQRRHQRPEPVARVSVVLVPPQRDFAREAPENQNSGSRVRHGRKRGLYLVSKFSHRGSYFEKEHCLSISAFSPEIIQRIGFENRLTGFCFSPTSVTMRLFDDHFPIKKRFYHQESQA